jgi:hypothetical protein
VPAVGSDILALIEHLNAGPAHIIANSYSPAPAIWAAAERPESIRSLVLINPFVRDAKINPLMKTLFWLMMNNSWQVQAWRMFYRTLYPTRKPADFEDYLDKLSANLAQPGRFEAVKAFQALHANPGRSAARVNAPRWSCERRAGFPRSGCRGTIPDGNWAVAGLIDGAGRIHNQCPRKPPDNAGISQTSLTCPILRKSTLTASSKKPATVKLRRRPFRCTNGRRTGVKAPLALPLLPQQDRLRVPQPETARQLTASTRRRPSTGSDARMQLLAMASLARFRPRLPMTFE